MAKFKWTSDMKKFHSCLLKKSIKVERKAHRQLDKIDADLEKIESMGSKSEWESFRKKHRCPR